MPCEGEPQPAGISPAPRETRPRSPTGGRCGATHQRASRSSPRPVEVQPAARANATASRGDARALAWPGASAEGPVRALCWQGRQGQPHPLAAHSGSFVATRVAFEVYLRTNGFYGFTALATAGKGGEQSELGVPSRVSQQRCPRALGLGAPAQAGCSTPPVCERRLAAPNRLLRGDGPSHHMRHWHHIRFFPALGPVLRPRGTSLPTCHVGE